MGYDDWLEAPYQQMMAESDAFYDWAEEEGYNLEDDDEMMDAEHAYQDYIADCEEDRMLAAYEARQDWLEDQMYDREDW